MKKFSALFIAASLLLACGPTEKKETQAAEPEVVNDLGWTQNSVIYEVNLRQYTPEGTIEAFRSHLPRLKKLGVDILWFMPIYPIGVENRKGGLGSYYSIQDYKAVNPEFGTTADFHALVEECHEMGFKVILDWVANHTAWDHAWVANHLDFYKTDSTGTIETPFDWTDVAQLDYSNKQLHDSMAAQMLYWVKEHNVDGFRCDVAGMVPVEFWDYARTELDSVKKVFMLAEAEEPAELYEYAFDANYGWKLHHIMNEIAAGKQNADSLKAYSEAEKTRYREGVYRMSFLTNHDENTWNGTIYERMGDKWPAFAALSYTYFASFPLIYSGQEAGLNHRLEFFVKDSINWNENDLSAFYTKMNDLKHNNPALYNGNYGGAMDFVDLDNSNVLAYYRTLDSNQVFTAINFSDSAVTYTTKDLQMANLTEYAAHNATLKDGAVELGAWSFFIAKK